MTAPAPPTSAAFQLVVDSISGDGTYGVTVEAIQPGQGATETVARIGANRLTLATGALSDAVVASGDKRTVLKATRKTPIPLDEAAGVRVALALQAIDRVSKTSRVSRLLESVARLSDEECFYWYAHTIACEDRSTQMRRLKAFRLFLTSE